MGSLCCYLIKVSAISFLLIGQEQALTVPSCDFIVSEGCSAAPPEHTSTPLSQPLGLTDPYHYRSLWVYSLRTPWCPHSPCPAGQRGSSHLPLVVQTSFQTLRRCLVVPLRFSIFAPDLCLDSGTFFIYLFSLFYFLLFFFFPTCPFQTQVKGHFRGLKN